VRRVVAGGCEKGRHRRETSRGGGCKKGRRRGL